MEHTHLPQMHTNTTLECICVHRIVPLRHTQTRNSQIITHVHTHSAQCNETPRIYPIYTHTMSEAHFHSHRGINKQPNKPTDDVPNRELSVSVVNALCVASLRLMVFKRGCRCQSEPSTGTFTYLIR